MTAYRLPWDPPPPRPPATPPRPPLRRGRRPGGATPGQLAPGWLYHHLHVHGPADARCAFAQAARGAGVIPWRLDFAMIEEDVFHMAAAQPPEQRALSIAGCRILARQFRERVEAHHARALARIGRSRACPFDLHALLPVPPEVLQLGPAHPQALEWLMAHWGTPDGLRHVTELAPDGAALRYGFFTTGASPHAAIAAIAAAWPTLGLALQPRAQA